MPQHVLKRRADSLRTSHVAVRTRRCRQRHFLRRALLLAAALAALLFAHASPAAAATHVTSNITGNTTWTSAGSPYIIDPSTGINVTSGATLTMQPGTIVKCAGGHLCRLNFAGGSLEAIGTPDAPITFTSIYDDSIGGDSGGDGATTGAAGDWNGLVFANQTPYVGQASNLVNVVIRYGAYGASTSDAALSITTGGSSNPSPFVTVADATITNNQWSGINDGGSLTLNDSQINNNGGTGLYVTQNTGTATVERTSFSNNGNYGFQQNRSGGTVPATTIFDSTLTGNTKGGVNFSLISSTLASDYWPFGRRNNIYANTAPLGGINGSGLYTTTNPPAGYWLNNYWGSDVSYKTYTGCTNPDGHLAYPGDTTSSPKGPISSSTYSCGSTNGVKDREYIGPTQFSTTPFSGAPAVAPGEQLGGPGQSLYAKIGLGFLNDPVNTENGNFVHSETDLAFPQTVGPQLRFARTYNSQQTSAGMLGTGTIGTGWSMSYSDSLTISTDSITFNAGDGSSYAFTKYGSAYVGAAGVTATLTTISGGYEITRVDGTRLDFDSSGRLSAIKDRNGQAITFTYDGSGRMSQATDAVGRSIHFSWNSGSNTLNEIWDSQGRVVQYAYGASGTHAGRLDTVQDARGTYWYYDYDSNGYVIQEQGQRGAGLEQVFKVTYNSSGQVTDQYDAFNNHTTYSYNSSTQTTTVTDPLGKVTKDVYSNGLLVQRIDPLNNTTSYAYDADDNLISRTDPLGKTTSYIYDTRGNMLMKTVPAPLSYSESWTYNTRNDVTSHTDGRLKTTSYGYDSNGNLTSITRPGSNTTSFAYDAGGKGELVSMTDPRGKTTNYGYDSLGERTSITDPDGNVTTYGYYNDVYREVYVTSPNNHTSGAFATYRYDESGPDGIGKLLIYKDALGHETDYGYDQVGNLTSVTNPLGKTTSYSYNDANERTGATFPGGSTLAFTYTARGELASATDQLGNTTTYGYDDAGRLHTKVTPRGNVSGCGCASDYTWTYGYDADGNLTSVTDPLGHETDYGYDVIGRKTSVTDPLSHETDYAYDADGNLTSFTDPLSHQTSFGYDDLNRKTSMTDARSKTTNYGYDANGNLTSLTDPLGNKTTYGYDDASRMTSSVDPRGNVTGCGCAGSYTTSYSYDADGNTVAVTDPLGHVSGRGYDAADRLTSTTDPMSHATGYAYDAANRLTTVTAPDLSTTTYGYDDRNNLTSRTDANLHTTTYGYNAANQLTSVTNPLSKVWNFTYDADGHMSSRVDAIANAASNAVLGTTRYSYDHAGRLTGIDYSDSTPDVGFSFDNANRTTSMTDGAGTESYGYDNANRLTSVTRGTASFGYAYNADNQLTQATYPDSTAVNLGYDDAGQLSSLTSGSDSADYSYDPAGDLTGRTLPDGSSETRTYDRAGLLSEIKAANGATTLVDEQVARNADGQPTQITRPSNVETYSYDNMSRLTKVCYQSSCPNSSDPQIAWTYDSVGNRATETRPTGTLTYSYNAGDQLTSSTDGTSTTNYSYDDNGRETAKGAAGFGYDMAGNLTSSNTGSASTSYSYDGKGNRLSATTGSATTNYSWDENSLSGLPQLVRESDGSGSLLRRYLYDSTGPLELQTPSTNYTYLQDFHGSIAALTTSGGTVAGRYSYEPFGARTTTAGTPPTNPLGFQGQFQDAASGLMDMRARQYDSADGRFTATDPLAPALSDPYVSAYIYSGDQPTVLADPSGLKSLLGTLEDLPGEVGDYGGEGVHYVGEAVHYGNEANHYAGVIMDPALAIESAFGNTVLNSAVDGAVSQITDTGECVYGALGGEMRGVTRQCEKAAVALALIALTDGAAEEAIGGSSFPRFVATDEGIIDTASPALKKQIDEVVDSVISTGRPPAGVRQGGLPGKPGVYVNKSGALPPQPEGYYTETDVWPGPGSRGTERLVVGRNGQVWYTPDHYGTFRQIR